jgi:hypothetical protein
MSERDAQIAYRAVEVARNEIECAILRTPTGEVRNALTDINIALISVGNAMYHDNPNVRG